VPNSRLAAGDVVLVAIPRHDPHGHEQEGLRPAVVTCVPRPARYPVVMIVPLTTNAGAWRSVNPVLYPILEPGTAKLKRTSVVLLDQMRSVDATRLKRYLGSLEVSQYAQIRQGLEEMCQPEA
jgi:mRNA interferase MazF